MPAIKCPQCGGEVDLKERVYFLACPYCHSALYLDRARSVLHYILEATIDPIVAEHNLRRWMGGAEMRRGLEELAVIESVEFFYFPMWYFHIKRTQQAIATYVEPAAPTSLSTIKEFKPPGGSLRFYEPTLAPPEKMIEPSIPYKTALGWLQQRIRYLSSPAAGAKRGKGKEEVSLTEVSLVHIPWYIFRYSFKDETYLAAVEGTTGKVFANVFPSKSEIPFDLVTIVAIVILFCEGMLIDGFLPRLVVMTSTALPLSLIAYFVAREF